MTTLVRAARNDLLVLVVVAVVLALGPVVLTGAARTIAVRVLLAALLAVAWNVMSGFAGLFSFGHAAYFGIGAYAGAYLLVNLGWSPWLGMLVGATIAAAFGAVTGFLCFRYELEGAYFALATFAFAEMLRLITINQAFLNEARGFRLPLLAGGSLAMIQFAPGSPAYYLVILALLLAAVLVSILFLRSRTGLFTVAIREQQEAAEASGVHAMRYKLAAVAVSAALTAVGGVFYFQYFFFIDPDLAFGPAQSVSILLPAVIGGTGTIWGPVVGAFILVPLGELTTAVVRDPPGLLSAIQGRAGVDLMMYAVLLVVIIVFLPRGVYGSLRERLRS